MSSATVDHANTAVRFEATNLDSVLQQQGRKQRWLADSVGVSESLISKLLKGKLSVDRDLGERIAVVLGVPFSVLFELCKPRDSSRLKERQA